jgi:hypothetical protein
MMMMMMMMGGRRLGYGVGSGVDYSGVASKGSVGWIPQIARIDPVVFVYTTFWKVPSIMVDDRRP